MKVIDIYKDEYESLRTQLFNLKFKMTIESKVGNNVDFITPKEEIDRIKKKMSNIIQLSQSDNKGGITK